MDIKIGSLKLHWNAMSRGEFRARALVYGIGLGAIAALTFGTGSDPKAVENGIYTCTSGVTGETISFDSNKAKLVRDPVDGPQMQVEIDGQPRKIEVNGSWQCRSPGGQQGQILLKP